MRPQDTDLHPMRILASAVVGRPVPIAYMLDERAPAWSDGERIYLARARQAGDRARELLVQCALLAGGSLGGAGLLRLAGSIDRRQRFLVLEVERCCAVIAERLPGRFLELLAPFATGCRPASAEDSLAIALGRQRLPGPPPWFGTLKPWKVMRQRITTGNGRAIDPAALAKLEARLDALDDSADEVEDDELSRNRMWRWLSSPRGGDGFFARFMREVFDMQSSPGKEGADSGVEGSSEMVSGRVGRGAPDLAHAARSERQLTLPSAFLGDEEGTHSYPEWDCAQRRYRPDWTCVEEVAPAAAEPQLDPAALGPGEDRATQRALAGLCMGVQRERRQADGEHLMLDPMVQLAVDLKSGHDGDERIYAASLRTRRDLAALILLDASSSTLEPVGDERVIDRQARAAWTLARSFERLGDRVALYGFHSWGRTLVRFQHLKSFDERLGELTRQRLSRLSVAGYTRCGAAIRHGTRLLERHSGMPVRVLLLLSDGYPYDDGYEGRHAEEDTRRALEEAALRGVACLCVSIGSDADATRLERAYGGASVLALDRGSELGPRLRRAMERAIGDAARVRKRDRSARAPAVSRGVTT